MPTPARIRYPWRPVAVGAVAAFTALMSATLTAAASTSGGGDLPLDDEFRTDPIFFQQEETAPHAAVWSDGKVSLAGLMSMQWARQEMHLTAVEYFGLAMLVGYAVVYIVGRRRNYQIAQEFITSVHGLFCSRFLEAGPASEIPPSDRRQLLARDSCNTFLYYATGSRRCSGVLVTIELVPRHDLFMLLWDLLSPATGRATDRVTVEVTFGDDDIEPMVFAVAPKRRAKKLLRDVPHLQDFATVTKAPSLAPLELACLSESSALVEPLLHPAAMKTLADHGDLLELLHVTDQNDEAILGQEETPPKVLRFAFRLRPGVGSLRLPEWSGVGPTKMMALALDYIETLNKFKMSAGSKSKALSVRTLVMKRKSEMTHHQRQERYQLLKNERLQREREEYESLTPEQRRRRDLKDEKKARKGAKGKHKMKLARA